MSQSMPQLQREGATPIAATPKATPTGFASHIEATQDGSTRSESPSVDRQRGQAQPGQTELGGRSSGLVLHEEYTSQIERRDVSAIKSTEDSPEGVAPGSRKRRMEEQEKAFESKRRRFFSDLAAQGYETRWRRVELWVEDQQSMRSEIDEDFRKRQPRPVERETVQKTIDNFQDRCKDRMAHKRSTEHKLQSMVEARKQARNAGVESDPATPNIKPAKQEPTAAEKQQAYDDALAILKERSVDGHFAAWTAAYVKHNGRNNIYNAALRSWKGVAAHAQLAYMQRNPKGIPTEHDVQQALTVVDGTQVFILALMQCTKLPKSDRQKLEDLWHRDMLVLPRVPKKGVAPWWWPASDTHGPSGKRIAGPETS